MRTLTRIVLAAALAASIPSFAQLTLRDDLGRVLVLKEPARRVVTLSPTLTEMAYAVGAGPLVVGVDSLSDYPPEVVDVAQVPTGAKFSLERVASLKPDLILAWREGTRQTDIAAMTAYGAKVFVANVRSIQDVPRLLEAIGQLTGRDPSAAIGAFEARLDRLRRANAQKRSVTAFVEIWNRPLTTIAGSHFISEALAICRAENVFAARAGAAPKVSWEEVQREDPFLVIGAGSASGPEEFRANWATRTGLRAVKSERLLYLDNEILQRPTPRMLEGMEQLCAAVDRARAVATVADLERPASQPAAPSPGRAAIPAPGPGSVSPAADRAAIPAAGPGSVSSPQAAGRAVTPPSETPKEEGAKPPSEPAVKPDLLPRPPQYGK